MTVPDLAELIAARGEAYRWELTSIEAATAGEDICPGPALRIEGVHMAAGEAFALERSEEHTSELQSLMRISYAVFCLKKKKKKHKNTKQTNTNNQTQRLHIK